MKDLIIVGAGGFAREVAWLIEDLVKVKAESAPHVLGFISDKRPDDWTHDLPILGDDQWAFQQYSPETNYVLAIGQSSVRKKLAQQYTAEGFLPYSLIHPSVRKSNSITIGAGTIVCAGSTLTTDIEIGNHVIINLHCTVGHDANIGDYCTLSPGVHVSGGVRMVAGCEIGTGAVLLPGVTIGEGCRVGAGAVVHRNLKPGRTYIGIPAREV